MKKLLILIGVLFPLVGHAEDNPDFSFADSTPENRWVAPSPVDTDDRAFKLLLQANCQHDADLPGQAFSILDFSAKRQLDENSVLAEGLVRFRKSLSNSDATSALDLRLVRISYMEPWFQMTLGRFDLFQTLTPNLFFGAYPIMGIHRADGVLATIPFSFLFKFGAPKEGEHPYSSPPLALSFFYTPSLFSAQQVKYDGTQAFWLSQLRIRIGGEDFASTFRVNAGGSSTNFFDYSSFNGNLSCSVAADLNYQQSYALTAEYGSQNIERISETGALALGFQASRLGTWGAFSIDQIALEAQLPLSYSLNNPFTGGNGLIPASAQPPQNSWYIKVRSRLKVLFIKLHVTNNRNDFTLARPAPGSIGVPFVGTFGPANETDGPGTNLRASSYDHVACLIRTGVEF